MLKTNNSTDLTSRFWETLQSKMDQARLKRFESKLKAYGKLLEVQHYIIEMLSRDLSICDVDNFDMQNMKNELIEFDKMYCKILGKMYTGVSESRLESFQAKTDQTTDKILYHLKIN